MLKCFSNSLRRLHMKNCQIHRFSSAMNFIIFIYVPLVHSVTHTFITTYTGINGQTIAGTPEFSSVTTLDGEQIDYYDSEIKKLIPRQDWMKDYASTDMWKEDIQIRQSVHHIYKNNINILMQRFNQSHGVHTYQRMYGCEWDDKTEESQGFDQHGYDGQDYVKLDVKELIYITAVQQGIITTMRWNNDRAQLEYLKEYYGHECVNWLKYFLTLRNADLERRAPKVSLLQKDPSFPVLCHATGFYPAAVSITWLRNGDEHYEDVDLGELLPNEDGTFQKTSHLHVTTDEWKKNQYVCVVEQKGNTIQKILTEDEIKSYRPTEAYSTILVCVTGLFIVLVIQIAFLVWKKKRSRFKLVTLCDDDDDGIYINKGL